MDRIINYLNDERYIVESTESNGIDLNLAGDELLIKGSKGDLLELANYIINIALSKNNNDHIHLDGSTIIDEDSSIKKIIIEKDE